MRKMHGNRKNRKTDNKLLYGNYFMKSQEFLYRNYIIRNCTPANVIQGLLSREHR